MSALAVGDWIHSYSQGIWQVSRIVRNFNEFRYSLSEAKTQSPRTLVFSRRLVNSSWKRSFASDSCELYWVTPITKQERQKVEQLLRSDDQLRLAFTKYRASPKPIDLIVNLRFGPLPNGDRSAFEATLSAALEEPIQQGLTLDEVLEVIRAAGYEAYMNVNPATATLQLVSPDHELRGADFVLKSFRILPF